MLREYLLRGFEVLTTLLGILVLLSFFFYTSKGLMTRKTLLVAFFCIALFIISLWITITIENPSISLPTLFCLGGVLIIASIDFAIRYATLPRFQKRINKMLQKEIKDK
jgi:hypothetical protein